ncbi:MAG: helix-turn-helix domain-containing protein [Mycobacterium sp.]
MPRTEKEIICAELATNLRVLRRKRRWSLENMAERVGVTASMISKYEHGDRLPSLKMLLKLAAALDTTASFLIQPPEPRGRPRKTEAAS